MQQDKFDGYYNIDFEHEINVNDLRDFLIERFPTTNILIESDDETIEHWGNHDNDKFDIYMSVVYLETDGVYDFEDAKTRLVLEISDVLQVSPLDIMMFLQNISQKINSKIYVLMTDVEKVSFSFSDYSFWCIDNDKRKVVFDAEEFCDNPKTAYQDYIPF